MFHQKIHRQRLKRSRNSTICHATTSSASFSLLWCLAIICYNKLSFATGFSFHQTKCKSSTTTEPPLIVLPGMAQSISAYEHHLPTLAQSRHVCIFQATGLGPINDDDQSTLLKDVSLPKQAERVAACLDEHLNHDDIVDLAGFSMGGRIALAMACLYPNRIRKIHLTGVAYQPSNHALVHYTAWKELLRRDNMEGFAWSALLGTYEPSFLSDQPERLARMIKFVSETHTSRGLLALLEQTHNEEWSVASMVDRLLQQQTATSSPNIHLCVGDQDRMATISDVLQLSGTLYNDFAPFRLYSLGEEDFKDAHVTIVKGCGHAVPMEAPAAWRRDVLNFLDKDE